MVGLPAFAPVLHGRETVSKELLWKAHITWQRRAHLTELERDLATELQRKKGTV